MPIQIENKKRLTLFLSGIIILIAGLSFSISHFLVKNDTYTFSDYFRYYARKDLLKAVRGDKSPYFADDVKELETQEILKLSEKNPDLLAFYSKQRIDEIGKLGTPIAELVPAPKMSLFLSKVEKENIAAAKFLTNLSQHPYQDGKESKKMENLLNQLKSTPYFQTYYPDTLTAQELLPTIKNDEGKFQTAETPYRLTLPEKMSHALNFNQKSNATATKISLQPKDFNPSTPKIYDNQALYRETRKGIDTLITTQIEGIKQAYILKTPESLVPKDNLGYLTLNYDLNASNLTAELDRGAIILKDSSGEKKYVITPPSFTDGNGKNPAQAQFVLTDNNPTDEINQPMSKPQVIPLTLNKLNPIPRAIAKTEDRHYQITLELKIKPEAVFPMMVNYQLLPVIDNDQNSETASPKEQALMKQLNVGKRNVDTNQNTYLLLRLKDLPEEAKKLIAPEDNQQLEKLETLTSSKTFTSSIDLPEEETDKEAKDSPFPDDPRNLNNDQPQKLSVRTSFSTLNDRLVQDIAVKAGQNTSSFSVSLKNVSNFSQNTYATENGDTQAYFGENEIITYHQSTRNEGEKQIALKENIYALQPNDNSQSRYEWEFNSTSSSKINLALQEDGSVQVTESMLVRGVDPNDQAEQQRVMDVVREAFENARVGEENTIAVIEPLVYVTKNGEKKTATYQIENNNLIIEINEPEKNYPLLIDPTFEWLEWLGGGNAYSDEFIYAIAIGNDDNEIYFGGYTSSSDYLLADFRYSSGQPSGGEEGFVAELYDNPSAAPTLNWFQWLGGTGDDQIMDIAVNGEEVYAGGYTTLNTNFETATYTGGSFSGGTYEGFAIEIMDTGDAMPNLNWFQWLGGSGNDYVRSVGFNGDEIYFAGDTNSSGNFETVTYTGGTFTSGGEAFIVEMSDNASSAPTLNWLQRIGGSGNDYLRSIAIDGDNIILGGEIGSSASLESFSYTGGTYSGGSEGFVIEIIDNSSSAPTLNWINWAGGTGTDIINGVAFSGNEIYAGGYASSGTGWETALYTGGSYTSVNEGFVLELIKNGSSSPTFNWMQWIGGDSQDYIRSVSVTGDEVYAFGDATTTTTNWEIPLFTGGTRANVEGLVVEMIDNSDSAPTLNWFQWIGGSDSDYLRDGAVSGDEIYAGGHSLSNASWETPAYTSGIFSGGEEGYIVEITDVPSSAPTLNWRQWLEGGLAAVNDYVYALSMNEENEIYVGGISGASDIYFGNPLYTGGTALSGESFVAEISYNAGAAPIFNWLQWLGGSGSDYIYALAVSGDEIYAGGYSTSSSSWESMAFTRGTFGGYEGFVVELQDNTDSAPTLNWCQWLGGSSDDQVNSIAIEGNEIYAGGETSSSNSWDATLYTGGTAISTEGFVTEIIDNEGSAPTLNWIQWLGGSISDYVNSVSVSDDEIYAGGYVGSAVGFEVAIYTRGTYSGNEEGFVVELLDNEGSAPTLNWLQWLGGTGDDKVFSIAANGDEIYAGGYLATVATGWETANYTAGTAVSAESFVVEILDNSSTSPTLNWLQWLGGGSLDYIQNISFYADEVYASGISTSGSNWENFSYTGGSYSGNWEGFVVEIKDNADSAPNLNWLQWLGGSDNDYISGLAVKGDAIFVGGYADAETNFEIPDFYSNHNTGLVEGFLIRIDDNPEPSTVLKSNVNLKSNIYLKQ